MTLGKLIFWYMFALFAQDDATGEHPRWRTEDYYYAVVGYVPHKATYWRPRGQTDECGYVSYMNVLDTWDRTLGRVPTRCRNLVREVHVGTFYDQDQRTSAYYDPDRLTMRVHISRFARGGAYPTMVHEWIHAVEDCIGDVSNEDSINHATHELWQRHAGEDSVQQRALDEHPWPPTTSCIPILPPKARRGVYISPRG